MKNFQMVSLKRLVSVPLRGCGFEMMIVVICMTPNLFVSVPLRGCGFEIKEVN